MADATSHSNEPDTTAPHERRCETCGRAFLARLGGEAERFLVDAFDPAQALPKSAEFLRELRAQFGNLGLAAAAYNAGPQRVKAGSVGNARCRRRRSRTFAA